MRMTFTGERYVPELRGQIYYEHLHRYALALPFAHNKDVLDVASGEGYGAAFLAVVAKTVVGVDIDEASVDYAASRYTSMNLRFMKGSAIQIPLADASVDVVASFETIEHLVEQERMLGEIRRVLRPEGHVIISSPNKLVYSDSRDYHNPFHVRELYFHEFRDLLRDFFPEVHIFGQRIFAGSAVHPLGGSSPDSRWLGPSIEPQKGIAALADPEYFVAVCSRQANGDTPNLASVYLDPRDDLLMDIRSGGLAAEVQQVELTANGPPALSGSGAARPAIASAGDRLPVVLEQERAEAAQLRLQVEHIEAERAKLFSELEHARVQTRQALRSQAEAQLARENLEDEIRQRTEATRATEREIDKLREQLRDGEKTYIAVLTMLATLRSALQTAVSENASVISANAAMTAQIATITSQHTVMSAQNAATAQLLNDTVGSTSWRLTAPIRKVAAKVRTLARTAT